MVYLLTKAQLLISVKNRQIEHKLFSNSSGAGAKRGNTTGLIVVVYSPGIRSFRFSFPLAINFNSLFTYYFFIFLCIQNNLGLVITKGLCGCLGNMSMISDGVLHCVSL